MELEEVAEGFGGGANHVGFKLRHVVAHVVDGIGGADKC